MQKFGIKSDANAAEASSGRESVSSSQWDRFG